MSPVSLCWTFAAGMLVGLSLATFYAILRAGREEDYPVIPICMTCGRRFSTHRTLDQHREAAHPFTYDDRRRPN